MFLAPQHGARPRPAVHFSIELHAGFSYKEGSVVAHDLPAQVKRTNSKDMDSLCHVEIK